MKSTSSQSDLFGAADFAEGSERVVSLRFLPLRGAKLPYQRHLDGAGGTFGAKLQQKTNHATEPA